MYTDKIEDFIYRVFICDRTYNVYNSDLDWLIRMTFIWSFLILIAPLGFIATAFGWLFVMLMTMSALIAVGNSSRVNTGRTIAERGWSFLTQSPARGHLLWAFSSCLLVSIITTDMGFMRRFLDIPLNAQIQGVSFSDVFTSYAAIFWSASVTTFVYWLALSESTEGN